MTTLTTFQFFNLLPYEIRKRIWELTPEPRRVAASKLASRVTTARPPAYTTPSAPAVLHTCSESRAIVSRQYTKFPGIQSTWHYNPEPQSLEPRYTWIKFDLDTVCMNGHALSSLADDYERHYVATRNLYIEVDCDDCFGWTIEGLIHGLPNLEFLEIRDLMGYPDWRREWNPTMDSWYVDDGPRVSFCTAILGPDPEDEIPGFTEDIFREKRKALHKSRREYFSKQPEYQTSPYESEWSEPEDERDPYRKWYHCPGCLCPTANHPENDLYDGWWSE